MKKSCLLLVLLLRQVKSWGTPRRAVHQPRRQLPICQAQETPWWWYAKRFEPDAKQPQQCNNIATVRRLATRPYHPQHSKPRSRQYTTRKVSREALVATTQGAVDDYNHYRTIALNNTVDRALSIVTADVMQLLHATRSYQAAQDGDLGENVLIEGIKYHEIKPGQVYQFLNATGVETNDGVRIQVTEPIIACANLCKLDYINQANKSPRDRIATCNNFIDFLNVEPGRRGWYAKVLQEGTIPLNATLVLTGEAPL